MATLLHDAVMNPAEGNVPWFHRGTVGDVQRTGEQVGGNGGVESAHQTSRRSRSVGALWSSYCGNTGGVVPRPAATREVLEMMILRTYLRPTEASPLEGTERLLE